MKEAKFERVDFDNWSDLLEFCRVPIPADTLAIESEPASQRISGTWVNPANYPARAVSYEDSLQLAAEGWTDAVADAEAISNPLFAKISSKIEKPEYYYDVQGEGLDIAAYCKHVPECWQNEHVTIVEGCGNKVIKLVFNALYSAAIGTDVIVKKGGLVVALVQLLEFAGYRVEVTCKMPFTTKDAEPNVHISILLKRADDELNIPRLMFALAHPAMLRRLGFNIIEHFPANWKPIKTGYGHVREVPEAERGDIYIQGSHSHDVQWNNPASSEAWIVQQLIAQGVELSEATQAQG